MKRHLLAAALAVSVALSAALADAKTFTWTSSLDALSMDPYSTNNSFTNAFMNNIYEALVRFNEKVQIEPPAGTQPAPSPTPAAGAGP